MKRASCVCVHRAHSVDVHHPRTCASCIINIKLCILSWSEHHVCVCVHRAHSVDVHHPRTRASCIINIKLLCFLLLWRLHAWHAYTTPPVLAWWVWHACGMWLHTSCSWVIYANEIGIYNIVCPCWHPPSFMCCSPSPLGGFPPPTELCHLLHFIS